MQILQKDDYSKFLHCVQEWGGFRNIGVEEVCSVMMS